MTSGLAALGALLFVPAWLFAVYVWLTRARPREMKVLVVIDGDTFEMLDRKGRKYRLRLRDCDCPEMSQSLGPEVQQAVQELIQGRWLPVRLYGRDVYRRHVGQVRLPSGENLCTYLVRTGLAYPLTRWLSVRALPSRVRRQGVWGVWFAAAPWNAASRRKGVWRIWGWWSYRLAAARRKKKRARARKVG